MIFERALPMRRTDDTKKTGTLVAAALMILGSAASCGVESQPGEPPETVAGPSPSAAALAIAAAAPTKNLVLEGHMRYGARVWPNLDLYYVYVNVINVGELDVASASIVVGVDGERFVGSTQKSYIFDRANLNFTIPAKSTAPGSPDPNGVIVFMAPKNRFQGCHLYPAQVDVERNVQSGPGVFDNDIGQTKTACPLKYFGTIDEDSLGYPPPDELKNNQLYSIVSSYTVGRPDGLRCSHCHYVKSTKGGYYLPDLSNQDLALDIPPNKVVVSAANTVVWQGADGWADRMMTVPPSNHSAAALDLVRKWIADGWQ